MNRITAMNAAKASYNYQLDATGNRRQVTESSGHVVNWSYDGIYRLTNETISLDPHSVNGSVGYGLDPVGNRQSQTSSIPGIGTGSFTYGADDRLSTENYDANGNTLTSGGKTFTYDFENRLKSMTAGSVTVTIQYDADGNRVAKTAGGVTTRYLVDELNPTGYAQVVEEVTAGAVTRQYTYGLQRISQTQQIANAWTPAFYGYDGGGTVRVLTDPTGTVTDTYDFDAWGNTVNTTGSTPNVYLYRGEQYDPDLSLYYLRARFYNPSTGRFVSTDPAVGDRMKPSTLHRYVYADASPVNLVDPSGRAGLLSFSLQTIGYLAFTPGELLDIKEDFPFIHWHIPDNPDRFPPPDCKSHPPGASEAKFGFPNIMQICNPGKPIPDQPWYVEPVPKGDPVRGPGWDEFRFKSKDKCVAEGDKRGFYSYAACSTGQVAGGFPMAYCVCCVPCKDGGPSKIPASGGVPGPKAQ